MADTKKPQRLNLKGGAKLRFEVTRMADNRLLLKQIAVIQQNGRTLETEYWRKECGTEEEARHGERQRSTRPSSGRRAMRSIAQ